MAKVVSVRFKPSGKSYDFDPGAYVLSSGDRVIVETEQGLGFAIVSHATRVQSEDATQKPLKKIFRPASESDFEQHQKACEMEKDAYRFCVEKIQELLLPMKLFSVDSTFDMNKLTFFFTAEGRVDFRELVKVLVRHFRVRIELRQIGVRHQAKMVGGLGRCGLETCCTSFMHTFAPVSVKMAKIQNLSLNPTKISGLCGRLMCCLTFENQTYKDLSAGYPKVGKTVETSQGAGKVVRHNVLRKKVTVRVASTGLETEVDLSEFQTAIETGQDAQPPDNDDEPDTDAENGFETDFFAEPDIQTTAMLPPRCAPEPAPEQAREQAREQAPEHAQDQGQTPGHHHKRRRPRKNGPRHKNMPGKGQEKGHPHNGPRENGNG